jgi:hypothetical protein
MIQLAVHVVLFAAILYFLFRPEAGAYLRPTKDRS